MGRYKVGSVGTDFTSQYWLSLDPCGLFCLSLSVTLHLFALFGAGQTLISHHVLAQCIYAMLYIPAFIMALWSLTMATTTNPGAVPMGARPLQSNLEEAAAGDEDNAIIIERDYIRGGLQRRRGVRRCRQCNDNYKPSRAHHDSVTGRCIVKMDHFCPWVGNAVGIYNHKFFILFIFYTFLTSIVSLILIIIRVIRCQYYIPLPPPPSSQHHLNNSTYLEQFISATIITPTTIPTTFQSSIEGCSLGLQHSTIIFILSIITVLFLLFTFCMLIEQSQAITTNMSKIARMKTTQQRGLLGLVVDDHSSKNEYAPVATEFNEIFGSEQPRLSWHWFIPLPVHFPEWAIDNIMGYEEPSGENEYDDTDGRVVGPYREEQPSVTDDGESNNLTTRSLLGISSLIPSDDDDDGVGGGTVMTFDVEEGNRIQQHQHESMPHGDKNIITPVGERRLAGIKRRSNNSPPLPLV